jgi:tetratricopeptide (TPR) repeat protein
VDRKTVARWLAGRVTRIQDENLERLARCLECNANDLTLHENNEAFATRAEQIEAVRLIERESLLEILGPRGEWQILESLIRATMRPDIPLATLGQLYNQLSIAAWRQSKLNRGEQYAERAMGIGRRCQNRKVIVAATLNLATLKAFRGRLSESLALYEECMSLSRFLPDELTRARAMSNLGATYLDAGLYRQAAVWQKRAIQRFAKMRRPMNEAIAWIGLANALKEAGDSAAAWKSCEKADALSQQAQYRRGACDSALTKAELLAASGRIHRASTELKQAREGFRALNIREAQAEVVAAVIARLEGRFVKAHGHIAAGMKLARNFPVERARLLAEASALERARGRLREASRLETKILALWTQIRNN